MYTYIRTYVCTAHIYIIIPQTNLNFFLSLTTKNVKTKAKTKTKIFQVFSLFFASSFLSNQTHTTKRKSKPK